MNVTLIRILLFCISIVGAVMLYYSIKTIIKSFRGKMISSFPLNNLDHKFYCPQQGTYGLWYKGPATYRPSFWKKPILIHADTNQAVALSKNLAAHRSSDFKGFVASLVFVFDAVQGDYQITYPENLGTYFYLVPPLISGYRQGAMTDFTIEIREALAPYKVLLLIPLILLSIFAFIGGLVMAILAEKMMLNGHFFVFPFDVTT